MITLYLHYLPFNGTNSMTAQGLALFGGLNTFGVITVPMIALPSVQRYQLDDCTKVGAWRNEHVRGTWYSILVVRWERFSPYKPSCSPRKNVPGKGQRCFVPHKKIGSPGGPFLRKHHKLVYSPTIAYHNHY